MPSSDLDIVNGALSLLGVSPISAIGEDSVAGGLAQIHYARLRDEALASHPWGFATKRAKLVDLPAPDEGTGYTRRLQLPADYLRLVEVIDAADEAWTVESRELWTNLAGDVWVRYIRQVVEPGLFSAPFVEMLEHQLATRWAEPLSKSEQLKKDVRSETEYVRRGARSADSQEGSVRVVRLNRGFSDER